MLLFTGSQRVGHNLVTKQQAQWGFPGGSVVKNPPANADVGSIPEWRKSPRGHSNSLQYSCLENPMDRGAWQATVPGAAKSQT